MELIEGSLEEQVDRVLSARFSSSHSESSENLLIWSADDLNSDDSLQRPPLSEFEKPRQISASDSNLVPSTSVQRPSPRVRHRLIRTIDCNNISNHEVTSYSRSLSFSSGSPSGFNNTRYGWQQEAALARFGNPSEREEVPNMEDYIELDMCSRSVAQSEEDSSGSEGNWIEDECSSLPNHHPHAHTLQPRTLSNPTLQSSLLFNTLPSASSSGSRPAACPTYESCRPLRNPPFQERPPPVHHVESGSEETTDFRGIAPTDTPINGVTDVQAIPTTSRRFCFHQSSVQCEKSTPLSLKVCGPVSFNNTHALHSSHTAFLDISPSNKCGQKNDCVHCDEQLSPVDAERIAVQPTATENAAVMLVPTSDLAIGESLTCTVVNILKVLRLLDRCGLEDLCTSLYGLRRVCGSGDSCSPASPNSEQSDAAFTRSSSFTSAALISPKRSTFPRDSFKNTFPCSTTPHPSTSRCETSGCLVNYILNCSQRGSSLIPIDNCVPLSLTPEVYFSGPSKLSENVSTSLNGTDWRRGCSDNLVTLLSSNSSSGPKHSRSTISRLLTGRFLPGMNGWLAVWPRISRQPDRKPTSDRGKDLVGWLSAWIHRGAAVVLAQVTRPSSPSHSNPPGSVDSVSELVWSHRLVYGITQNADILITNPIEAVSIDYLLEELSRQPTVRLEKRRLIQLWSHHLHNHSCSVNSGTTSCDTTGRSTPCSGDFSFLACQADPRWNHLNVLGQVLQTLRGVETTSSQSSNSNNSLYLEHSCLSPTIVIPSVQFPGFSVFVARSNWELVHALCDPCHGLQ
ncbi:hypothetical protein CRM22_002659 [Opisthorchis felineus]|uniref:Uncharacterized protein n=1 Tax=Opisthorchis felineus TaxID=147828 RepID=A0A4S2M5I8_OPIFE|nr:hypothetical protein CRM22_002659 [Opisthorchis felineus]